ncbi:COG1470 family protein [Wenyingzhuangia sp. IMCC45467]
MNTFRTVIFILTLFFSLNIFSQLSNTKKGTGVSVSPAHLHLTQTPGSTKSYKITINNDTQSINSFRIRMKDFEMTSKGQSVFLEPGKGKYPLSQWTSVSPNFVDLAPFEKKEITVTVSIPVNSAGNKAAWEILMIEQEEPRESLNITEKRSGSIGMGVIPTFAFGVFVYQNPPTVNNNNVQLINFKQEERTISIQAENKGDGIAYCSAYIDLTNLTTGTQERFPVKKFTILPELIRDFKYKIPEKYKAGKYIAIGVLDYESAPEIQAAKLEFEIN